MIGKKSCISCCLLELMQEIVNHVADTEHNVSHSAREDKHCIVSIFPYLLLMLPFVVSLTFSSSFLPWQWWRSPFLRWKHYETDFSMLDGRKHGSQWGISKSECWCWTGSTRSWLNLRSKNSVPYPRRLSTHFHTIVSHAFSYAVGISDYHIYSQNVQISF